MRTKHKIKAAALTDLTMKDKWIAAYLGERNHPEAITLVDLLTTATDGASSLPLPPEKVVSFQHKRAWQLLLTHFRTARIRNDGSFFRHLADTIEALPTVVDPRQASIASEIMTRQECNQPMPTVPEMMKALAAKGIPANRQTVHRIFGYFGITPAKAQRGRQRKRPK